jgi:hypothetical protein
MLQTEALDFGTGGMPGIAFKLSGLRENAAGATGPICRHNATKAILSFVLHSNLVDGSPG